MTTNYLTTLGININTQTLSPSIHNIIIVFYEFLNEKVIKH